MNSSMRTVDAGPSKSSRYCRSAEFKRFFKSSKKLKLVAQSVLLGAALVLSSPNIASPQEKDKTAEIQKKSKIPVPVSMFKTIKLKELLGSNSEIPKELDETKEGFSTCIGTLENPIWLENGKTKVTVSVLISNSGSSSVVFNLFKSNNILIGVSDVSLDDLKEDYQQTTGNELRYVHVIPDKISEESASLLCFYIVPASTKKNVVDQNVEVGMPVKFIILKKNESGNYVTGQTDLITAAPELSNKEKIDKALSEKDIKSLYLVIKDVMSGMDLDTLNTIRANEEMGPLTKGQFENTQLKEKELILTATNNAKSLLYMQILTFNFLVKIQKLQEKGDSETAEKLNEDLIFLLKTITSRKKGDNQFKELISKYSENGNINLKKLIMSIQKDVNKEWKKFKDWEP